MPMFSRKRLRPLVTMSCLNLCYHLSDIARLTGGVRYRGDPQVGRTALCSHGHDQALAEVLDRAQVSSAIMQCGNGSEPAQHLVLAINGQHLERRHELFGELLVALQ